MSNELKFEDILEASADALVVCDHNGTIVFVNERAEDLFGYPREEMLGKTVELLIPERFGNVHPHHRQNYLQSPQKRLMGRKPLCCRRKDGSEFIADITIASLESGAEKLAIASVRDITSVIAAQQKMARIARCTHALSRSKNIQATTQIALFNQQCACLVASGCYQLAWIAVDQGGAPGELAMMSIAGESGAYFAQQDPHWNTQQIRQAEVATAFRDKKAVVTSNLFADVAPGRTAESPAAPLMAAMICLPFGGKDSIAGVLTLYTAEAAAFDAEEIGLLEELVEDFGQKLAQLSQKAGTIDQENHLHANYDPVTGLGNKNLFLDKLQQAIETHAGGDKFIGVIYLDLDRFQSINESCGHALADNLLRVLGQRLCNMMREEDTLCRITADEFCIAIANLGAPEEVAAIVKRILHEIAEPYIIDNVELFLTASAGISFFPRDGQDPQTLLQHADAAMHSTKEGGGNSYQFYATEINQKVSARLALDRALRHALEQQSLQIHFQPKVSLMNGEVVGAEALLRWNDPEFGEVPPSEFIPMAEASGLIMPIGAWMLDRICAQMRIWLDAGIDLPPVAINLSGRQFRQEGLAQMVRDALEKYQIDPTLLVLEITESTAMLNVENGIFILNSLKSIGIKLSIDDFGTGYSSLSYLKRLPLDQLKIDQAFVKDICNDPDDKAICLAIIGLAHTLKMSVVAEGVETEAQLRLLRQHHCDELQGYLFSQALDVEAYTELLQNRRTLALPKEDSIKQQTILLVDDEANILSALKRLLRRDGYTILTAGGGAEGLEILAQQPVDVIVSDQRMPNMTGADFLRRAKELYPSTVRMMLSGYTELQSVTEAVNEGAIYKFLTKPWEDDLLRVHIQEAFKLKNIADENESLHRAVLAANAELAVANRKMEVLLQQKMQQISQVEINLDIAREVLEKIPLAVLGVDDEGMIAFVNESAEILFNNAPLLGDTIDIVLPELNALLLQGVNGSAKALEISGKPYLVSVSDMGSRSESIGKLIILKEVTP